MLDLEILQPVKRKAQNWNIGQCYGKLTEEYCEAIMANRDLIRCIKEHTKYGTPAEGSDDLQAILDARREADLELVDLMTACRTLLWRRGYGDKDFSKLVRVVNEKNRRRGYID